MFFELSGTKNQNLYPQHPMPKPLSSFMGIEWMELNGNEIIMNPGCLEWDILYSTNQI